MRLKKDLRKSSGFSSSLSPWNGVTCSLDISFSPVVEGSGFPGGWLTGELLGVVSNGVRARLVVNKSKPDKLEGGRVMSSRLILGEVSKEGGVRLSRGVLESKVDVVYAFLMNRPDESLVGLGVGPLLFVRSASVANVS